MSPLPHLVQPYKEKKKGDILQTNGAVTCVFLFDTDDIECDAYLRSEKQLSLELKTLERKLKEVDERRIVEYEEERKKEQNEQRENVIESGPPAVWATLVEASLLPLFLSSPPCL